MAWADQNETLLAQARPYFGETAQAAPRAAVHPVPSTEIGAALSRPLSASEEPADHACRESYAFCVRQARFWRRRAGQDEFWGKIELIAGFVQGAAGAISLAAAVYAFSWIPLLMAVSSLLVGALLFSAGARRLNRARRTEARSREIANDCEQENRQCQESGGNDAC